MQSQLYKQQSFTLTLCLPPGIFRCGGRSFVSITIQAFSTASIQAYMHARCTSTSCMHNLHVHKIHQLRNVQRTHKLSKYTTDLCSCFSVQTSLCVSVSFVRLLSLTSPSSFHYTTTIITTTITNQNKCHTSRWIIE